MFKYIARYVDRLLVFIFGVFLPREFVQVLSTSVETSFSNSTRIISMGRRKKKQVHKKSHEKMKPIIKKELSEPTRSRNYEVGILKA